MTQASLAPYSPEKGVNDGIMDLTDEKTLEEYSKAQAEFLALIAKKAEEGKFYFGIVPYQLNGRAFIAEAIKLNCKNLYYIIILLWKYKINPLQKNEDNITIIIIPV